MTELENNTITAIPIKIGACVNLKDSDGNVMFAGILEKVKFSGKTGKVNLVLRPLVLEDIKS